MGNVPIIQNITHAVDWVHIHARMHTHSSQCNVARLWQLNSMSAIHYSTPELALPYPPLTIAICYPIGLLSSQCSSALSRDCHHIGYHKLLLSHSWHLNWPLIPSPSRTEVTNDTGLNSTWHTGVLTNTPYTPKTPHQHYSTLWQRTDDQSQLHIPQQTMPLIPHSTTHLHTVHIQYIHCRWYR